MQAPNIDSELQRILGGASLEEKSDAVDSKDPSPVGRRGLKCDSVSVNVSHQEPVTLSVETDLTDSMDDAPRTEDNVRLHVCVCVCECVMHTFVHVCASITVSPFPMHTSRKKRLY